MAIGEGDLRIWSAECCSNSPLRTILCYVPLNMAEDLDMNVIGLLPPGSLDRSQAVFPTRDSSIRAILERGLDYGSDGAPPSRRIVEFNGGSNRGTWPVVMGAYIGVRLNASIPSAAATGSCRSRFELFKLYGFSSMWRRLPFRTQVSPGGT